MKVIGPCTKHIVDAIEINQMRKLTYSRWSRGASMAISEELIKWEKKLYLGAALGDLLTSGLRRQGVNFLERELVDMKLIPALPEQIDSKNAPNEKSYLRTNIRELIKELHSAHLSGYSALQARAQYWIEKHEVEPRLNCTVRHFLESIRAFSRSAPEHLSKVSGWRARYLKSLIDLTIKTQINDLNVCQSLDEKALPLQTEGILILYWDIPPIH